MKKFLSTVLALVMVAATFTMLVPNAVAAVEQAAAVEPKVLYEENFDDLNGKSPAEILEDANMKDEIPTKGDLDEMTVRNGKLRFGDAATVKETYVILQDDERLANGFVVEYDVEWLGVACGR